MKYHHRYTLRSLAYLRPYWLMVTGAYIVMLLINGANIWMPIVVGGIVDAGIRAGVQREVVRGVILLLGIATGKGVLTFLSGIWTERASQGVAYDIRNRFHQKLQELSFSFHDESETGQILSRSVQDVDRVRFLTGRAVLHLVQMAVQILGVSVAMFVIDHRLALMVFIIVPLLVVTGVRFGAGIRPVSMKIRQREARLTARLEQNLHGARIVKAFAREGQETGVFDGANTELLTAQRLEARIRSVYLPLMQLLAGAGTVIVLVGGGRMVIAGELSMGTLVTFMTYLAQLLVPIRRFGWLLSAVAQASASAERIFEILDLRSDIQDAPDAREMDCPEGEISFEGVSLSYQPGQQVLDQLTFTVTPGEKLALLGSTGSGKSSVTSLIPRFYDPTDGAVCIDGNDIRGFTLKSLRDQIGTVLQDTVLFAASIRENIAFGRPDSNDAEIEEAARAARIHDYVVSLPRGYDSYVGEKGVTLSGGQKQRISIARAILKNPRILILDDATSSVDSDTEQLIQEALETLMRGRTAIIIAHRLSTVRTADQVLVLENGRVEAQARRTADESPHDQLVRISKLYAEIFARQFRDDPGADNPGADSEEQPC